MRNDNPANRNTYAVRQNIANACSVATTSLEGRRQPSDSVIEADAGTERTPHAHTHTHTGRERLREQETAARAK